MSTTLKLSIAMILAVVVGIGALIALNRPDDAPPKGADGASAPYVREDSPRLTKGDKATFVEFLDFECEACGAAHPLIKDLRDEYGEDVTFVVRYFPLHGNSMNAALAAEAARQQGKFEQMHDKIFETQAQWSHKQTSQADVFEQYAKDLGLDMEQFRADLKDPKTTAVIEQSQDDARSLGVTGTPSFFIDGKKFEPKTAEEFGSALDAAVGR